MQRADPRAVEGALHFHRAILSLQRFGTQPALLFCRASSSSPVLNAGSICAGIIFCRRFIRSPTFSCSSSETSRNMAVGFANAVHIALRLSAVAGAADLHATRQLLLPLHVVKDFTFRLPVSDESGQLFGVTGWLRAMPHSAAGAENRRQAAIRRT